MKLPPARRFLSLLLAFLIFLLPFLNFSLHTAAGTPVWAAEEAGDGTPKLGEGPSAAQWEFDPVVTEVGKNAERGRQLLWWVFSHPAIHTAPVIASLWGFSRNLVYIFIILVIVAFGVALILSKSKGTIGPIFSGISSPFFGANLPSVFVKIGGILLYVTFSYIFILIFIQISEIAMRFFIENVGGRDLFNVVFAGSGNADVNYTGFVGYRDVNPINQEMANTSLFLVRMTSLTYYTMAIIVILRAIILWFLLIVSPFLALLMPFVFIRNVGWIWIGVFFQWLFYGPLMALFLASLTKIWVSGIPYPFDFSRVNTSGGQVYRTAINILYGGPAQTLSAGNTANYIDTYAEYVIALVMLWTAIILPWLLLRIFRDYCCEAIMAGNSMLSAIFDRIRQYPPPSPPTPSAGPTATAGMTHDLPFRQKIEEKIHTVQKEEISRLKEISQTNTQELARSFNLSVSSLKDVSRLEMNKQEGQNMRENLRKISQPSSIISSFEREKYASLRKELETRAATGDMTATSMLHATEKSKEVLASQMTVMSKTRSESAVTPVQKGMYAPTVAGVPVSVSVMTGKTTQGPAAVSTPPAKGTTAPSAVRRVPITVAGKQVQTQVSVEDYEDVKKMWMKHYRDVNVPTTETIKSREQWLDEDIKKLTNISNMLASEDPKIKQKGLTEVSELLPFLMLGGFSDLETLTYLKAKLEAAKQIKSELEIKAEAKKEAVSEVKEEEETLLEVKGKKKEEEKAAHLAEEMSMEMPSETKDNPQTPVDKPQDLKDDTK